MAEKKSKYFAIGLFMLVGIIASTGVVIWLGASQYFKKGNTYLCYFDESVQGLQKDSSVKYRGVVVGTVDSISVAPDGKLIEVQIKVDLKNGLKKDMVAELKMAGITGIVFVELDLKKPREPDYTPDLKFTPPYQVIPTRPSDIKQLLDGAGDIVNKIGEIDFKGLSDEVKKLTVSLDKTVNSKEIKGILKNIDMVAARLNSDTHPRLDSILSKVDNLTEKLDRTATSLEMAVSPDKKDGVIANANGVLLDTRTFIGELRAEIKDMKLGETSRKAGRLADELALSSAIITRDLESILDGLRQTSEGLDMLVERVKNSPSDLLFSKPPTTKRPE